MENPHKSNSSHRLHPQGFQNGAIPGFSPKIPTQSSRGGVSGAGMGPHGREEHPWKSNPALILGLEAPLPTPCGFQRLGLLFRGSSGIFQMPPSRIPRPRGREATPGSGGGSDPLVPAHPGPASAGKGCTHGKSRGRKRKNKSRKIKIKKNNNNDNKNLKRSIKN